MLYAWHGAPAIVSGRSYDSIFPDFIVTAMPPGARGLMIAAILAVAMSNASGSLNSLAASSVVDFQQLRGLQKLEENPEGLLRRSRWMTLVWGIALAALATVQWGPMLVAGLTIAAITLGSLLGLFLLTFLFPRATAPGVLSGMFAGLAVILYVHFRTPLLWTWYVPLSAGVTFLVGATVSVAAKPSELTRETR
jgi:SSS family solute:Na+ symporter